MEESNATRSLDARTTLGYSAKETSLEEPTHLMGQSVNRHMAQFQAPPPGHPHKRLDVYTALRHYMEVDRKQAALGARIRRSRQ